MKLHAPPSNARLSLIVLLTANGVVLWGVLAEAWPAFPLLFLFWMENVIVGVMFAGRLLLARPDNAALWGQKLFLVPFFCFHYGMFTLVHGLFVITLFGGAGHEALTGSMGPGAVPRVAQQLLAEFDLWVPLAALAASHAFSLVWNFLLQGEYLRARPKELMTRPYGRVVALHVSIIAGGALAMGLGSPLWALVLLLAIKTAMDALSHMREHRRARPEPATAFPDVVPVRQGRGNE